MKNKHTRDSPKHDYRYENIRMCSFFRFRTVDEIYIILNRRTPLFRDKALDIRRTTGSFRDAIKNDHIYIVISRIYIVIFRIYIVILTSSER